MEDGDGTRAKEAMPTDNVNDWWTIRVIISAHTINDYSIPL